MGSTTNHYFDEDPTTPSSPLHVELILPDLTTTLASDRGVFSSQQIDAGTRYLLLEAPEPSADVENVADIGCGYGAIARTLAHRAPDAHIWAIDVNARARELATANLEGFDATVAAPDEVADDVTFDLIWSNPPIRIGKQALHQLLTSWLGRLSDRGTAVLVVQRHLGADSLANWLRGQGWAVTRLGSRQGYRLLEVRRP